MRRDLISIIKSAISSLFKSVELDCGVSNLSPEKLKLRVRVAEAPGMLKSLLDTLSMCKTAVDTLLNICPGGPSGVMVVVGGS